MPLPACHPHNMTFLPFGNAKLCGIIIPDYKQACQHKGRVFLEKSFVAEGGRSQMIFCKAGLISLDKCLPDTFDFLPLDRFSATSGGLPNLSIE